MMPTMKPYVGMAKNVPDSPHAAEVQRRQHEDQEAGPERLVPRDEAERRAAFWMPEETDTATVIT